MTDNVVPINAVVANVEKEVAEASQHVVSALEQMLTMARAGELLGIIGILQFENGSVGNVSAGGGKCHPYLTLGALEALTEHHKLAIMNHVALQPAFTGGPSDAPTAS